MTLALGVCIVGLMIWVICLGRAPEPLSEIGRIMFMVGLLAYLLQGVGARVLVG